MAKIARKEESNFPNATAIEEEVLLPSDKTERTYPQFSPDGKELAFIEDRNRLMVINLETKRYVRSLTVPPGSVPAVALTIHGRRTANGSHWNLSETGMIHIPI